MPSPTRMAVKTRLAYGPKCDWGMACLSISVRRVVHAKARFNMFQVTAAWEQMHGNFTTMGRVFYGVLVSSLAAGKFSGAELFYWAASRHRLFFYWPVSTYFFGREGVSPDLPLPGWKATGRHSWAGVGEELAEGWEISVKVLVRLERFSNRRLAAKEEAAASVRRTDQRDTSQWRTTPPSQPPRKKNYLYIYIYIKYGIS